MRDRNTSCGSMPLWKWTIVFLSGLFVFMLAYGLSAGAGYAAGSLLSRTLLFFCSGSAVLGLYACWTRLLEKRWPSELSLRRMAPGIASGMAIGFLLFCAITAILAVSGHYSISSISPDWMSILTSFWMFFVVAAGEEIVFRGILFRMIDERFSTWAAVLISSLVFGFVHIMNDGATVWSSIAIAIEAGLMLSLSYKYSGTLWLPIGIHWAWNFTQGNVFGFGVSGTDAGSSIIEPAVTGPEIITGGAFGPEASVIAASLGLLISLCFLAAIRRRPARAR